MELELKHLIPIFKLLVNGKIKAEEIEVVVDVPADYVFASDCRLLPIRTGKICKRKSPLTNVPSADAIKENGWAVGEVSNKLLEKIEELTLYMIELESENEELKKKLEEIEQKLNK